MPGYLDGLRPQRDEDDAALRYSCLELAARHYSGPEAVAEARRYYEFVNGEPWVPGSEDG